LQFLCDFFRNLTEDCEEWGLSKLIENLLSAITTVLAIALLTFLLMKAVPGGPFDGDKALPPEVIKALEAKFRLDLPWYKQFTFYIRDILLDFDFGPSIKFVGRSVTDIVLEALPVSMELGLYALVLATFSGIGLGVLAAAKRGSVWDVSAMIAAISGVSLPSFLVGAIAIYVFVQQLGWLPGAFWDHPENKILPSIVLGLRPMAIIARQTRSAVLEVWPMDFVRTARAKGLAPKRVLYIHVLRNAFLPVLTLLGPLAATVLTGSFIVEHIFSIPGLGSHFINAVINRDYPLIMGVTLIFSVFLIGATLMTDVLYSFVDPRIKKHT
jgi:ABC-type dipeptide/oligopeptide/nickel transport system permease component